MKHTVKIPITADLFNGVLFEHVPENATALTFTRLYGGCPAVWYEVPDNPGRDSCRLIRAFWEKTRISPEDFEHGRLMGLLDEGRFIGLLQYDQDHNQYPVYEFKPLPAEPARRPSFKQETAAQNVTG